MHDVFYFTDVHGQLDLFQAMRNWCLEQDPECMIIFGGDACDRGKFGFDIMQEILDDPQIVYIRGNHEDMFVRAAREIAQCHPEFVNRSYTIDEANSVLDSVSWLHGVRLHWMNGGKQTLKDWLLEGADMAFIDRLEENTVVTFALDPEFQSPLCFSHAGSTYESWQNVNDCEYNGTQPHPYNYEKQIWDREYLGAWWPEDKIIVFGHTPTCYLRDYVNVDRQDERHMFPVAYKPTDKEPNGWHIAMDTGMTFYGHGYVLNCLTMEMTHFFDPNVNHPIGEDVQVLETYKII